MGGAAQPSVERGLVLQESRRLRAPPEASRLGRARLFLHLYHLWQQFFQPPAWGPPE